MPRFVCSSSNLSQANRLLPALVLAYVVIAASAQNPPPADPSPSAPQPQLISLQQLAQTGPNPLSAGPTPLAPQQGGGDTGSEISPVKRESPEGPVLTMAPHPEGSRYWLSGQANIIIQGDLPFHSLYQGANSF